MCPSLCYTVPSVKIFFWENCCYFVAVRKWVCHWATKRRAGFVFPTSYPHIVMEQLKHVWKPSKIWTLLTRAKRDNDQNKGETREWTDIPSLMMVCKNLSPWSYVPMCHQGFTCDALGILSSRLVKMCVLLGVLLWSQHSRAKAIVGKDVKVLSWISLCWTVTRLSIAKSHNRNQEL